jgi:hypothetical protein
MGHKFHVFSPRSCKLLKNFGQKRRDGVIKRRNANLLRKGFIENPWKRRDKPAQRFRRKPMIKNTSIPQTLSGVINRRNGLRKPL